jgi:uncharacterized protein (TIGR00251 family)
MKLRVHVTPRARRTAIDTAVDGVLRIRLAAPPVDGAANFELLRFLGKEILGLPPSSLSLARGQTGRHKTVDIPDLDEDAVWARIRQAVSELG